MNKNSNNFMVHLSGSKTPGDMLIMPCYQLQ